MHSDILRIIADLVDFRDSRTGGHVDRTQRFLSLLLQQMKIAVVYQDKVASWDLDIVLPSAQLHDVGKIGIADSILKKENSLTEEEFIEMQKHAAFGVTIIEQIEGSVSSNAFLRYAKVFVGNHHEKWDGTGYPNGLKGEGIPLQGRVMAIADVYDALTAERPYKEAFSHEKAVKIIGDGRGTHFDPNLVDIFMDEAEKFRAVCGMGHSGHMGHLA